jgi:hypothetical protein
VIPAGGSGTLTAKIKTRAGRSGKSAKSISVFTDAPDAPKLRLLLGYDAVTPIVVSPHPRVYVHGVEGSSSTAEVLLHRTDGEKLEAEVKRITVSDGVKVTLETVTESGPGPGQSTAQPGDILVTTELGKVPAGFAHNGLLVLGTNHPDVPELNLQLSLMMRPLIGVRPKNVQLWPEAGGPGGTEVSVRLHHGSRKLFGIESVEVLEPQLVEAQLTSVGDQRIHAVRVSLPLDFAGVDAPQSTVLRITTNLAEKPVIDVPVTVTPSRNALRTSARRPIPGGAKSAPEDGGR